VPAVLLVTQDLQRAGAQRQCVELALGLAQDAGWRVEVAAVEPDGPLGRDLRDASLPLHACPRRWRWDLSPAARLAALVRRGRPDVVHTSLFLPNFYGRLARLVCRPPVLVSSLRSTGIEGWPRYLAEILMAPLCDAIIANSEAGKADLVARGVHADRVVVVRNGLDFARFDRAIVSAPPCADGIRRIGMVAQMESRKDHIGLVEAFARIRPAFPSARLVLAGDGRLRPVVEERVRRLALGDAVEILGTVDHPERIYLSLEVYVQASAAEEGTSNSILEAMACGRPVAATDIGGNREVVQDGTTGLIVPARDPEALAAALRALLADPHRARAMGAEGARLVRRRYSRAGMVRSTVAVYEDLLYRRRRPA